MGYGVQGITAETDESMFPVTVPGGATLRYEVKIVGVKLDRFAELDLNRDRRLSLSEIEAHFKAQKRTAGSEKMPAPEVVAKRALADEDKDSDGFISWHEFSGPKGEKVEL